MKFHDKMAIGALGLTAFLMAIPVVAQERVDANGMPTTHSTPAEQAQTAGLNAAVTQTNGEISAQDNANKAQYAAQRQNYQDALQQHDAAQQQFQEQSAAYENLRARYAAERAAYQRDPWPNRWARLTLEQTDGGLVGQRVQILNGDRVGTVREVAHTRAGHVAALKVELDSDKVVWIDQSDIRYDRADGVVVTNLRRDDLRQMADERL